MRDHFLDPRAIKIIWDEADGGSAHKSSLALFFNTIVRLGKEDACLAGQSYFAESLGVTVRTIKRWEAELRRIGLVAADWGRRFNRRILRILFRREWGSYGHQSGDPARPGTSARIKGTRASDSEQGLSTKRGPDAAAMASHKGRPPREKTGRETMGHGQFRDHVLAVSKALRCHPCKVMAHGSEWVREQFERLANGWQLKPV